MKIQHKLHTCMPWIWNPLIGKPFMIIGFHGRLLPEIALWNCLWIYYKKILSKTLPIVQSLKLKISDKKFSFKNLVTGKLWLLFQIPMFAPFRYCFSLSFLNFSIARKLRAKFATQSEQWFESSNMTYYLFSCFWFPLAS